MENAEGIKHFLRRLRMSLDSHVSPLPTIKGPCVNVEVG